MTYPQKVNIFDAQSLLNLLYSNKKGLRKIVALHVSKQVVNRYLYSILS